MQYTAAMIVLLAAPLVSAPPPTLVREINLNQILPAMPDFAPFAAFAFSPDENWLAVSVGMNPVEPGKPGRNANPRPSILLLLPLNGTAGKPVQIDPGLRPLGNPAWSPDSATILLEGFAKGPPRSFSDGLAKLWNLKGDELLSRHGPGLSMGPSVSLSVDPPVGGIFGFLDSKHLLARRVPAKGMPPAFETLDLQGQVVDTWMVPKHWTVADISPERGLLAILTDQTTKTLVVDHASKQVIRSEDNPSGAFRLPLQPYAGGAWQFFAENGKTLCSVGSVGTGQPALDTITECWDVDSGTKIAEFHGFPGGAPAAASSHGSRLVLSRDLAFPKRDGPLVFPIGKRVVWDFRAGGEIAAWEVPQIAAREVRQIVDSSHILDHVAISSSGRYVAETVGDLLRIYQLP